MIGAGLSDVAFLGNRIFMKLEDAFDRANQQGLGNIPVAERPWELVSGNWSISNNRAVAANTNDPIAVVNAYTPDVDISLNVSSTGYDGIVFRYLDENNYLRLVNYYRRSSRATYTTLTAHRSDTYHSSPSTGDDWDFAFTPNPVIWAPAGSVQTGWTDWRSGDSSVFSGGSTTDFIKQTNQTKTVRSGTRTTITRRVRLEKIENGRRTLLRNQSVGTTSVLRVVADGDTIQMYTGGVLRYTTTEGFNSNATKHGITRGSSVGGSSGSALNNFSLTPTIFL